MVIVSLNLRIIMPSARHCDYTAKEDSLAFTQKLKIRPNVNMNQRVELH